MSIGQGFVVGVSGFVDFTNPEHRKPNPGVDYIYEDKLPVRAQSENRINRSEDPLSKLDQEQSSSVSWSAFGGSLLHESRAPNGESRCLCVHASLR